MKDEIQIFRNEEFGEVRTVMIDNEPWFVAVDICRALDIANPTQALARLDEDEKMTLYSNEGHSEGKRGGARMLNIVNEAGLYTLILGSRKPEAKSFKRWITHDVIPAIRKHGVYMTDSLLDQVMKNPEIVVILAGQLVEESKERERLTQELQQAQPKADYFDAFVNASDYTCIRNCGKELGIPQNKFIAFMLEHKYLYRNADKDLMPSANYVNRGFFVLRDVYLPGGRMKQQAMMTCKGKEHFRKMWSRKGGEEK